MGSRKKAAAALIPASPKPVKDVESCGNGSVITCTWGEGGSNLKKSCGSGSVVMELVNLTDNNASGYRPRGVECSSYGHTQLGVLTTGI